LKNPIIVITAPSGTGKTSITKYLISKYPQLDFSISATTRQKRHYEIDSKDYYFINEGSFLSDINDDKFIEWEMVYKNKYYGTYRSEIERIWESQKIPVLDLDVKGALHIKAQFPSSIIIFIQPPSIEELSRRLENRNTETPETMYIRLNKAQYELSFKDNFDYIVTNDVLEDACDKTGNIIHQHCLNKLTFE